MFNNLQVNNYKQKMFSFIFYQYLNINLSRFDNLKPNHLNLISIFVKSLKYFSLFLYLYQFKLKYFIFKYEIYYR